MSETNNNTTSNTTSNHLYEAKSDARYLKLEILQLAAELESALSQYNGGHPKLTDIIKTADALADFVFAEEPTL
jgi:hypothetical protein